MVSEEVAAAWRERARRAGINIAFSMAAALLGGPPSAGGQAVAASADESSTAERTEFALGGGFHVSPEPVYPA